MRPSSTTIRIELENDTLIMHGTPDESPGCVLRGVLNLYLKQPLKAKSLVLRFTGKIRIAWTQTLGATQERYFEDEKVVLQHEWRFLASEATSKVTTLAPGNYAYEFELPLKGDLPESVRVGQFYNVQYQLKALLRRPHLFPNYACHRVVHLTRHPLPSTMLIYDHSDATAMSNDADWLQRMMTSAVTENHADPRLSMLTVDDTDLSYADQPPADDPAPEDETQRLWASRHAALAYYGLSDPVLVVNQWVDKIDYEISMPTKYYHHGDVIPVRVLVRALVPGIQVRCISCTFKEYATCRPVNGWFGGRSKSHGRILYYARHNHETRDEDASETSHPWDLRFMVPISSRIEDTQYDLNNEASKVRHKLKFQLNIFNPDGHMSELRAVLPIAILAKQAGSLPSYEQSSLTSFPYDPSLMAQLLQRNSRDISPSSTNAPLPPLPSPISPCIRLPTYDEVQCH